MLTTMDRVWLLTLFLLAAFVLALEVKRNMPLPRHVLPPQPGKRLTSRINLPNHRDYSASVKDVGFIDPSDAANAANEGATRIQDGQV